MFGKALTKNYLLCYKPVVFLITIELNFNESNNEKLTSATFWRIPNICLIWKKSYFLVSNISFASNEIIKVLKSMLYLLKKSWLILATWPLDLMPFSNLIGLKITERKISSDPSKHAHIGPISARRRNIGRRLPTSGRCRPDICSMHKCIFSSKGDLFVK